MNMLPRRKACAANELPLHARRILLSTGRAAGAKLRSCSNTVQKLTRGSISGVITANKPHHFDANCPDFGKLWLGATDFGETWIVSTYFRAR